MDLPQHANYYLEPGYVYFSRTPAIVRTVVGSCVAVCVWDRLLACGGASHFLRPAVHEPDRATPQYGNVATATLIRIMEEAGCQRKDLVAQISGGAFPQGAAELDIGAANVQAARTVLMRKGVPVISEDVGGSMGRKIAFDTSTGQLVVLKVHKIRTTDWILG